MTGGKRRERTVDDPEVTNENDEGNSGLDEGGGRAQGERGGGQRKRGVSMTAVVAKCSSGDGGRHGSRDEARQYYAQQASIELPCTYNSITKLRHTVA